MSDSAELKKALEQAAEVKQMSKQMRRCVIPDIYFDKPDDFSLFNYFTSHYAVVLRYSRA